MSLHGGSGDLFFPKKNYYGEGMYVTPNSNINIVEQGTDPKPLVLELCKP